ncbi:MAG: response regulator [Brachymonas sp.]|nr:response regulator [Brachymonas sp.]
MANEVKQRYELKKINQELDYERQRADAANAAKSQFFTSASHDARQPLQAIALLSDALIRSKQLQPEDRQLVERIDTNLLSIRNLFNRVLDISRIESGAVEAVREKVSLQKMWGTLDAQLSNKAEAKGLWLRFAPTDSWIEHDAHIFERILVNLIDNAIKFTETGGVWVAYRKQRKCIEVRDSGVGLGREDQSKVFDEFYQVGNSARKREDGAGQGLGLAIVKRLCDLTHSEIRLRSNLGRGCVFSIAAQAIDVDMSDMLSAPPSQQFTHAALLRDKHVLVFDDDRELCELLCNGLQQHGAQTTAHSEIGPLRNWLAHAKPESQPLDLLITDFRLGGEFTGLDVIRWVRRRYGSTLPVLVVTGDTNSKGMEKLHDLRELAILYKPVDVEELAQQSAKLLQPI